MGWNSNDGLHEGYLAVILVGGESTTVSNGHGPVVMVRDDSGVYTGVDRQHADDEIVAWQLRCDCSVEGGRGHRVWEGLTWNRVAAPLLEDLSKGQIYAALGAAGSVSERADVEEMAFERWRLDHIAPAEALDEIRAARLAERDAADRLRDSVPRARAAGRTWEEIGKAAGMSRQSAQQRWG